MLQYLVLGVQIKARVCPDRGHLAMRCADVAEARRTLTAAIQQVLPTLRTPALTCGQNCSLEELVKTLLD